MRWIGGALVLAGSAALAGAASAAQVPIPPVPLPPAPVTLPAVTLPSAPAPAPSPSTPAPLTQSVTGSTLPATSSAGGSSTAGGDPGGSASGRTADSGSTSDGAGVEHFNSSRPWIGTKGPRRRRVTTLSFVLPAATRVVFTVDQVSPACLGIGRFSVAGHGGLNRVPFVGRVQGRTLGPGTYRISARTAAGRVLHRVTLVVVDGSAPSRSELTALRAANTCGADTGAAAVTGRGRDSSSAVPARDPPRPLAQAPDLSSRLGGPHGPSLHSGVLATGVEKTAKAIRPLLVALLVLAILLLALASVPRLGVAEPRFNYLLARHRLELAGLGAASLVAVALAFLLA